MKKLVVCGALAAFALGTQAASAAEFYIVRDATTKKCTVVDTKPTTTTTTVVGNGVYKTKTEAESAVKTTKVHRALIAGRFNERLVRYAGRAALFRPNDSFGGATCQRPARDIVLRIPSPFGSRRSAPRSGRGPFVGPSG